MEQLRSLVLKVIVATIVGCIFAKHIVDTWTLTTYQMDTIDVMVYIAMIVFSLFVFITVIAYWTFDVEDALIDWKLEDDEEDLY